MYHYCYENELGIIWKSDEKYFAWGDFDRCRSLHWAAPRTCSIWHPFRSMHCLAWRIEASAAARHTKSGRRRTTGFTASLRTSKLLGMLRYTWPPGTCGKKKTGGVKSGEHAGHGCVSTWSQLRRSGRFSRNFQGLWRHWLGTHVYSCAPHVCRNNPRSLEDLNVAVKPVVHRLPLSVCHTAAETTIRRAKQRIERNFGHIEHVFGAAQYGDRRRSKSTETKYLWSGFQVTPGLFW